MAPRRMDPYRRSVPKKAIDDGLQTVCKKAYLVSRIIQRNTDAAGKTAVICQVQGQWRVFLSESREKYDWPIDFARMPDLEVKGPADVRLECDSYDEFPPSLGPARNNVQSHIGPAVASHSRQASQGSDCLGADDENSGDKPTHVLTPAPTPLGGSKRQALQGLNDSEADNDNERPDDNLIQILSPTPLGNSKLSVSQASNDSETDNDNERPGDNQPQTLSPTWLVNSKPSVSQGSIDSQTDHDNERPGDDWSQTLSPTPSSDTREDSLFSINVASASPDPLSSHWPPEEMETNNAGETTLMSQVQSPPSRSCVPALSMASRKTNIVQKATNRMQKPTNRVQKATNKVKKSSGSLVVISSGIQELKRVMVNNDEHKRQ